MKKKDINDIIREYLEPTPKSECERLGVLKSFIRLEELAELKVEDIDLEAQRLLVRRGKMGKGRWAGFGPGTRKSLWGYLGLRQEFALGNALWVSEEGRRLTARGIQEIFRCLKRDAGLQHM